METNHYLGDGVYADIIEDGAIVLKTDKSRQVIFLEPSTQIALAGLIERRRRAEAEFELAAERMEMSE